MHSVPLKEETSSQQTPYSEEIVDLIIKITKKDQEGFNS